MELGVIGLGRMGVNMAERLLRGSHRVAGYDRSGHATRRSRANMAFPATGSSTSPCRLRRLRIRSPGWVRQG